MGTALTGLEIKDTYDGLVKTTDNGPLSATAKYLSDGLGNDSVLALSTSAVGVGTSSPAQLLTLQNGNVDNVSGSRLRMNMGPNPYWELQANNGGVAADRKFIINTSSSAGDVLTLTQAGNVGIGTSSPAVKLVVNSTVNTPIFQVLRDNGTNGELSISFPSQQATFNSAVNDMVFQTVGFERARFTANGLTFNGDTAAANALDDYEEGTWTIGITFGGASVGVTTSSNTGTYTKIGRQVTVNGVVVLTSKGSSTGSVLVTGLPFIIGNNISYYPSVSVRLENVTFANQFQAYGGIGSAVISLNEITEAGVNGELTNTDFANNSTVMLSATYFV